MNRSQATQALRPREDGFTPKGSSPRVAPPFIVRPHGAPDFAVFRSDEGDFEAYVLYSVLDKIDSELARARPLETIGLLAGRVMRDTEGPYTLVLACEDARGDETEATPGHVRITAQGHAKLRRRLELAAFGLDLVGWYHSHPTFPARFSSVDTIEQSTLKDPHHVGIVASGIDNLKPYGVYKGPKGLLLAPLSILRRPLDELAKPVLTNALATRSLTVPQTESVRPTYPEQVLAVATSAVRVPSDRRRRRKALVTWRIFAAAWIIVLAFAVWISLRVLSLERRLTAPSEARVAGAPQVKEREQERVSPPSESRPADATTTIDLPSNPKLPVAVPSSSPKLKSERRRAQRSVRGAEGRSSVHLKSDSTRRTNRLTEPRGTSRSTPQSSPNPLKH